MPTKSAVTTVLNFTKAGSKQRAIYYSSAGHPFCRNSLLGREEKMRSLHTRIQTGNLRNTRQKRNRWVVAPFSQVDVYQLQTIWC